MEPAEKAVRELIEVYNVLAADVEEARQYGQKNPSGFAHRTLFRTHFALVEGLSHQLRRVAEIVNEHYSGVLEPGEIELLRDYRYRLDDKGRPTKTAEYQQTLPAMLFAIRTYAKAYGLTFEIDLGDDGYGAFKDLIRLRNGLTHPKCKEDLELTDPQFIKAAKAAVWWKDTIINLIEAARAKNPRDDYLRSRLRFAFALCVSTAFAIDSAHGFP